MDSQRNTCGNDETKQMEAALRLTKTIPVKWRHYL